MNLYKEVLYDYQKRAVDSSKELEAYALWMKPGTGKTYTSISIAQEKAFKKVLIVCKSSKLLDWAEDAEKALYKATILNKGKAKDDKNINEFTEGAIVVSYQTAWRRKLIMERIKKEKGQWIVIIDESQNFKERTAQISKWGVQIAKAAKNIVLLSGTPAKSNENFYNQLVMLGLDMKWPEYRDLFCTTQEMKFPGARWPATVVTGDKNREHLLNNVMPQISFTMRTEDAIELPPVTWTTLKLQHKNLKAYKKMLKDKVYQDLEIPSGGVAYMRARQFSSGFVGEYQDLSDHKKEALEDLLSEGDDNFVIFYSYVQELADIKEVCAKLGIAVFEQNGQTKNDRDSKTHDGRFVIASQYQSGNDGMNWQYINYQLYYSPTPSYLQYEQSWARVHRIGQTKNVFYYRFLTMGTVEERMYKSLEAGKDYSDELFSKEFGWTKIITN